MQNETEMTESVTFRVSKSDKELLLEIAQARPGNLKLSDIIREAIDDFLKTHRPHKASSFSGVRETMRPVEVTVPMIGCVYAAKTEAEPRSLKSLLTVPSAILNGYIAAKENLFALTVAGDGMEPAIKNGDILFFCKGLIPKENQIVAVLLNNQLSLKRFFHKGKKAYLKNDNPKHKEVDSAEDLIIQGVMLARMGKQKE